jgi:hypothetical protein
MSNLLYQARGRQIVAFLTNKSGAALAAGDVVILDSANNEAVTTTNTAAVTSGVGVAQEAIFNGSNGRIAIAGHVPYINVNGSNVNRGDYARTALAKTAGDAGAARAQGTFAQFMTSGTAPSGLLFPIPDVTGTPLSNPMTTTDDIIRSADNSGTPARLAKGSAGAVLAMGNSTIIWNAGTSFPASKATNDRHWRTDILGGMGFLWDGTRWVSDHLFREPFTVGDQVQSGTVTQAAFYRNYLGWAGAYDVWHTSIYCDSFVSGTNNGTNYWTVAVSRAPSVTSLGSFTTIADAGSTHTSHTIAVNALAGTSDLMTIVAITKTLSPGPLFLSGVMCYRMVAT